MISFSVYWIFFSKYYWDGPDEKKFTVEKGSGLNVIIDNLEKNDIIADRSLFKIAAVLTFKDDNIISNSYLLKNGMSNYDLLKILTDNTVSLVKIIIPEGFTLKKLHLLLPRN
ncbi:MAG: endolytic transglycosylase MltG [Ignavibacteria bacterium]|nr:endolytic transglycosylase MltG [Ignavibacteria bacterium]